MIAGITEKEQKIIERILDKYRKDYAFFYYGSRVKGTYEKTSDLDVLIKGKAEMPLAVLQKIKEEFDKSDLPYIVNFSDYYKLDGSFYERIKPDLIPYNWQEVKLGDVCFYVSQKMDTQSLSIYNYISTENMLPNKSGITNASSLPNISITPSFKKDDILVSNIRPYFKKIWLAQFSGGCSNDVLVFRANKNIDSKFLYYILSDDRFFEYSTQTSKGTKMPRGDKTAILKYAVSLPPLDVQKKIAGVLGALDDKIELNNKINKNLEAQAQALFKSWFVDFEPFGGQMPDDWKIKTIGDVCASISETYNRKDENVVLINTSDVLNGEILTHSLVKNENLKGQFKKTFQKNDILYSEIRPINKRFAFVDIENTYNYIASTKLMVIRPDTSKISPLILYRILKSQDLIDELQHLAETRSGTFPQITFASELAIQKIVLAPLNEQKIISNVLEVLENKIRKNIQENLRLAELRDTLLPKLMSGEINVDDVKID